MRSQRWDRPPRRTLAAIAGHALIVMHVAGCHAASAHDSILETGPLERYSGFASLEQAFWTCDYVATTRGVDATPVAACSAIYTELKNQKFGGDFSEMLGWWKENKRTEHRKLAESEQ